MTDTQRWCAAEPGPEMLSVRHINPVFITINAGDPGLWNAVAAAIGGAVGMPPFGPITAADISAVGASSCPPAVAATHAALTAMADYLDITLAGETAEASLPPDIRDIIAVHDPDACAANITCLHGMLEQQGWAGHVGEVLRSFGYSHYRPAVTTLEG